MAHGLEVWDATGVKILSVADRLTRLIYQRDLPANESSSVVVPEWDAARGVAVATTVDAASFEMAGHAVFWSGTTISWAPMAVNVAFQANSILMVFLYR